MYIFDHANQCIQHTGRSEGTVVTAINKSRTLIYIVHLGITAAITAAVMMYMMCVHCPHANLLGNANYEYMPTLRTQTPSSPCQRCISERMDTCIFLPQPWR